MAQQKAWSDPLASAGDGRFKRKQSEFRQWIRADGSTPFAPAAGRYHLYVQYACPWAHRTLLARKLFGLEDAVSVDVVDWRMRGDGAWVFNPAEPGCTTDRIGGATDLQDVYRSADSDFSAIGTVPVLWDRETSTIVNNESREILRMFDQAMSPAVGNGKSLLPAGLVGDVDAMIDANYESVNNGVYKCGFARTQEAYDDAADVLFGRLEELDDHLEGRKWLVGAGEGQLTEADVCLWPTLLRFDPVYHTHFKTNRAMIRDYRNLWAFLKRFYALPGVADTVSLSHIQGHYYASHKLLNPHGIIPRGPPMEFIKKDAARLG